MNKARYTALREWFKKHDTACKTLKFLYKFLPLVFVLAFPTIIVIKGFMGIDKDFITIQVVPVCVFFGVTLMRRLINRPRPYEKYELSPVLKKDRKGCSFPSRHSASAFIIAMCGYVISLPLGIVLTVLAALVAVTRVLAGVHYIFDVVFAALFSAALGLFFFFII